jgi:hypothetical protein
MALTHGIQTDGDGLPDGQQEELMEEPMESRYGWRMELQTDKKQITRIQNDNCSLVPEPVTPNAAGMPQTVDGDASNGQKL